MIKISKEAIPNYLCKVVELKNIRKHENADRLQVVTIDFQDVITGLDASKGDIYVYFPIECQISEEFLSATNEYRDKTLNQDSEQSGFFEKNSRVRAVKLRGQKSMGYIVPAKSVFDWAEVTKDPGEFVGQEFDTINNNLLVKKYVIPRRSSGGQNRQGKKPKVTRLIDGQIHLHVDTENLRRNAFKINPDDTISVTYKTHGTSFWVSNVKVKKKLGLFSRFLKFTGLKIQDTEYDIVYGSRRVVKNSEFGDPKNRQHYYGTDIWGQIKDEIAEHIPKGYTLYGECLGYTKDGAWIQKDYDYGCEVGDHRLEIYRITFTNEDGLVTELTYPQIDEFCRKAGIECVHDIYVGRAGDMYGDDSREDYIDDQDHNWAEQFIQQLEKDYNEKNCFMCNNEVPEEGIVVRKENLFSCESYKLKSFKFLERETKQLDSGEENIEDN